MRNVIHLASILAIGILAIGCGKDESASTDPIHAQPASQVPTASGGVAIVDLDEISRQLGRDAEMAQLIAARQTELNQQLNEVQQALRQQYDDRAQILSQHPQTLPEAQAQQEEQLAAFDRQLGAQLQQAQQVARNQLQQYQTEVISQFREETKPFARTVAKERGLSVVMTLDEVHMLAYAASVDITDAVAERMATGNNASPDRSPTANRPSSFQQR